MIIGIPFIWTINVREAWLFIVSMRIEGIHEEREKEIHKEHLTVKREKKEKDQKINGDKKE